MDKRKRIISIALSTSLIASVFAAFFSNGNKDIEKIMPSIRKSVQCTHHEGNHYHTLAATADNPGSLEYYVCCKCNQSFVPGIDGTAEEIIASGDWTDTHTTANYGNGGITEKAYIPPTGPINVTTLEELEHELTRKTNLIRIAADITVTRTIYATNGCVVYSDADHSLIRGDEFSGAIFDVMAGKDLTIGKDDACGTLTIDGNCTTISGIANPLISVYGSATLNMRDHVELMDNYSI